MASCRLFKDALTEFVRSCESRYKEPKDLEMLHDFLLQWDGPEKAKEAVEILKADAEKKWKTKKVGDTKISNEWIESIMNNITNFAKVGDYAMQSNRLVLLGLPSN